MIRRNGMVWHLIEAKTTTNETPANDLLAGVSEAAGGAAREKDPSGTDTPQLPAREPG